jgi:hypothetical protein
MGRGLAWDWLERQLAAKAYVLASENNICGADQKTSKFQENIYRYIQQFTPPNSDPNKFSGRSIKSIYVFLKTEILPDVQKFSSAINVVKACLDTGNPSETDIHCMAIAHHLKMANGADTRFMVCGIFCFDPKLKWPNYMAFLELKKHPKFFTCPSLDIQQKPKPNTNIKYSLSTTVPTFINDCSNIDSSLSDTSNNNNNCVDGTIASNNITIDEPSRNVGQKKAKHQLKSEKFNEKKIELLDKASTALASLATSHAAMVTAVENEHIHKKSKLLNGNYKIYKNINPTKAALILQQIDNLSPTLLDDPITNVDGENNTVNVGGDCDK